MAGLAEYSVFFENPAFTNTVRQIPVPTKFIAGDYLPRQDTFETKFYDNVITRQADMANIVSGLAHVPLTDRDPMKAVSGEIADIAQGYLVTKEELGALMDKGTSEQAVGRRKVAELQVLQKSAAIKGNVDARIEWMGWQAMGEGTMSYNKNGVIFTADFGIPAGNIKVAGVKWDDVTPTILADYEAWAQAYSDLNGELPDDFVTSLAVTRVFMNDATVRKQVTGFADKVVTLDELNAFLTGRQMPTLRPFDGQVTYRDVNNNGNRVTARLLNAKKGVFLKRGAAIGNQLMGPTIENNMNPGIFAETIDLKLPTRSVINVVASSFPKIMNPNLIMPATVLV